MRNLISAEIIMIPSDKYSLRLLEESIEGDSLPKSKIAVGT